MNGITDISAPIKRGDRAIAALTVPYIKTTYAQGPITAVADKIKAAANSIGSQLIEGDRGVEKLSCAERPVLLPYLTTAMDDGRMTEPAWLTMRAKAREAARSYAVAAE